MPGAILLVEDDPDVRESIAEALREEKYWVFTAHDGAEALRLLDGEAIPRPCIILLDWLMAPMSGEEFVRALDRRPDAASLPVLVVSAAGDVPVRFRSAGVVGTLRKPFELGELLAIVDAHCARGG